MKLLSKSEFNKVIAYRSQYTKLKYSSEQLEKKIQKFQFNTVNKILQE